MTKFYTKNEIELIFSRFAEKNPTPLGELNYHNNFTLLVAVLLSAQATDKSVNKATAKLFTIADNAYDMNKLTLEEIEQHIRSIGLWRTKAKNVKLLAEKLITNYNGIVPEDFDQLLTLPGVGRKTANVVLNLAFDKPTLAVDTHIFRIANRTKMATGSTPLIVENKLLNIIPCHYLKNAHIWLILHGRYICTARNPLCNECCINDICKADCNPYANQSSIFKA